MSKYGGRTSYSRYRGRTPKWKIGLAVVLVLVILCSGMMILMQKYLIYDDNGQTRLEMPWTGEEPEHEAIEVPELEIEEPVPAAVSRKALELQELPLTLAGWQTAQAAVTEQGLDTAAVVLRQNGKVFFNSETALHQTMAPAADTMDALARLTGSCDHAVGLVSCFLDPIAAQAQLDAMGLKNTGGYVFYDGSNRNWLDPAKPETLTYVGGLLRESAALGFDELVLRDFTFPTQGKLNKIAYTPGMTRTETLTAALKNFRAQLDAAGFENVELSVELPSEVILSGEDSVAGLKLADLAAAADAIYARTTPEQAPALAAAVEAAGTARFVPEFPPVLPAAEEQTEAFLVAP